MSRNQVFNQTIFLRFFSVENSHGIVVLDHYRHEHISFNKMEEAASKEEVVTREDVEIRNC